MYKTILLLTVLMITAISAWCQESYRIRADIVMKVKNPDSTFQLTRGNVCYDLNYKKIVYRITFPQQETYVSIDTLVYRYEGNKQVSVTGNPVKPEYSIYHFILNNDIADFGLKKSNFRAGSVEKSGDLVITKWIPPPGAVSYFGDIIVSSKNKRLNTVLIYNAKKELVSRQIYKSYQTVNGVEIPAEILSVSYGNGKKLYQIIDFRNIIVNETGHDTDYNFNTKAN